MSIDRIEVMGRATDLTEGVKARTADAYWALGRQWQTGEFQGDLGGQPVTAVLEVESQPLQSFRGGSGDGPPTPIDLGPSPEGPRQGEASAQPLERLIEQMPAPARGTAGASAAARIGEQILRLLDGAGVEDAREMLRQLSPLKDGSGGTGAPGAQGALARLHARRAIDGLALLADEALTERMLQEVGTDDRDTLRTQLGRLAAQHLTPNPAWDPTRLEYSASTAALTTDGEVTLQHPEHHGGHLDWYHADIGGPAHKISPDDGAFKDNVHRLVTIPTPVRYTGQPSTRWWEFEDGRVHMGDINAGPTDFARLAVAEFAMAWSDDWFVIPVRVPTGTISRVHHLTVVDSFGVTIGGDRAQPIDHVAVADGSSGLGAGPFRLFEMAGDASVGDKRAPWLYLPPVLGSSMDGAALERLILSRDEGANLAWAVEERTEGWLNRGVLRSADFYSRTPVPADPPPRTLRATDRQRLRLTLEDGVPPPWWVPLIPQRFGDDAQMRLRRGRMRAWAALIADDEDVPVGAIGELLQPDGPLAIEEEEVPRSGATVERRWQHARWSDGSVHVWRQHAKRLGHAQPSSGLRWDQVEPLDGADGADFGAS